MIRRALRFSAASLLLVLGAGVPAAPARETGPGDSVSARLAAAGGEITVGDLVTLKLTVTHPPGTVFEDLDAARLAPEPAGGTAGGPAGIGSFIVEDVIPVEAKPPLPGETSWSILIRPFTPGEIRIAAFPLTYRLPSSPEGRAVMAGPLGITVQSVLQSPEEPPADIKGPWRLPPEWWRVILYGLAGLAALASLAWILRRYRRRGRPAAVEAPSGPPVPAEPPYARAVRDLEILLASSLLAEGRVKEFHVALSEIVKRFLGDQHRFGALDRTTEEVMTDLERLAVVAAVRDEAQRFLRSCDFVKFAKHRPARAEIGETVAAARLLIETGRPAPAGKEVAAA